MARWAAASPPAETAPPEGPATDAAVAAAQTGGGAANVPPQAGQPSDAGLLDGADSIKEAVAEQSMTVAGVIEKLDAFGFTVSDSRFSLWTLLLVVMVLVGIYVVTRLLTKLAHRLLQRMTRLDPSQRLLGEKLLAIGLWATAILIGIDILGIDLTTLAVFSGALGLAIGFGLQKTFGNLISGIILLMDRSIKPGDVIAVSDLTGRESFGQIRKIGIRAVSVVTRDRKEYLIPNENLMINQVENWSYSSREVRVKAPVGVAYGTDIELAEKLLLQAAVDAPRVLTQPEPKVLLMDFSPRSIDFEIRFWIMDPEEGVSAVRSEVLKRVWQLFTAHGIEIPVLQQDITIRDNKQFQQLVAALLQRPEKDG